MSNDYEKLFLIEILVDSLNINIDKVNLDPSIKSRLGETCVMFQFLDHQPMVVCEEAFVKQGAQQKTGVSFNHGKSCLFSLNSSVCPTLPGNSNITLSVMRKINSPEGNQHTTIGSVTIPMGDSFTSLIRASDMNKDNVPGCKTKAGSFNLVDSESNAIGTIEVFIRLTCLDQMVVTQIQYGGDDKAPFLFKGTDNQKIYEIPGDETKRPVTRKDETKPSFSRSYPSPEGYPSEIPPGQDLSQGNLGTPQGYPSEPQVYPDGQQGYDKYGAPSQEQMNKYYDQRPPPAFGGGPRYDEASSTATSETKGNFKEVFAYVRGHALKIRVPRKQKKNVSEDDVPSARPYYSCQQLLELQKELQGPSRAETPRCQCACMRQ